MALSQSHGFTESVLPTRSIGKVRSHGDICTSVLSGAGPSESDNAPPTEMLRSGC